MAQTLTGAGGILLSTMTTATIRRELSPPHPPDTHSSVDWRRVATAQHCVLMEGPKASIEAVLMFLEPYLHEPVMWRGPGGSLALPHERCGALVLQDIARLDRDDQTRLLTWLDDPIHRTQVVATTPYPLFPLVECGLFDATLYYRLNTVRLFVGGGTCNLPPHGSRFKTAPDTTL